MRKMIYENEREIDIKKRKNNNECGGKKNQIWRQTKYEKNGKKKIITIEKKMREDRKEKENL